MNWDVKSDLRFEELFLTHLYSPRKSLSILICIPDSVICLHNYPAQAVIEIKRLIQLKISLTALLRPKNT